MDIVKAKMGLVSHKVNAEGRKVFTYRATTEAVDRQGEIVTLDGWRLDNYKANPVILDSHRYDGIESIVGKGVDLAYGDAGLDVDILFSETNPRGRIAEGLASEGMLNTLSVGFRSLKRDRAADGVTRHIDKELLEISVVAVPANPEAVRLRSIEDADMEDLLEVTTKLLALEVAEVKAGRTLSTKNEGALRQAGELINAVLSSLDKTPPADDAKADTPDTTKALDLTSLEAFLGRTSTKE